MAPADSKTATDTRPITDVDAKGTPPDVVDEEPQPDQRVVLMAKHLDAWAETNGEDVVEAALDMYAETRNDRKDAADKAAKADAAHARAAAAQDRSAAPTARQTPADAKAKA
jgi:hypothetical protein